MHAALQQPVDHHPVFREGEEFRHALGHNIAHIRQGHQRLLGRLRHLRQRAESIGQIPGGLPADVGNADGEQERVQGAVLALVQGRQQLVRLALLEALQRQRLLPGQMVQIRRIPYVHLVVELLGGLFGQALNVHGVTAGEVADPCHGLRLAADPVHAEQVRAPLHQRTAAGGADSGLFHRRFALARLPHPAHDLGNHIVGAADPHRRADGHLLALDVAPVVQRGLAHRHTVEVDGIQMGQGRQLARAAQLPGDAAQGGDAFLRLKLVGHRPPGELVREAHLLAQRKVAHLDHHAVDEEIQAAALPLNFPDALLDFLPVMRPAQVGADGEAVLPEEIQHPRLGIIGRILDGAHLIKERVKPPRRGHRRIQIAQGSGGGVAGVLQRLFGRFVVFFQRRQAHDALALHFQKPLVGDAQRHGAHRPGLGQDGLPRDAVAPGGRLHQLTVPVGQVQRQAVKLVFHIVLQLRPAGQLLRAADPVLQRADGLHLVHAPQLGDVPVWFEARQGFAAHPVGG